MSTPVRRALYGKLASDTTLTGLLGTPATGYTKSIYYQEAPSGAGFPFVILNKQSGVPTGAFSDPAALDTDVWLIKAVDRASSADAAEAVQARVQALLNDATLSISGATHLYLRRESDVDYSEVSSGVTYRHAGSLFRLMIDPGA
jgi:hypothetical protein